MQNNIYDTIIIGLGPAGLQAAIYTARANLKTAVFGKKDKSNLWKSHLLANYFGFDEDITGSDLLEKGLKQAQKFKTEIFEKEITSIKIGADLTFELSDDERNKYQAKTVIFATGMSFTASGIENEDDYVGKGVSYCVTCDGFFFKDKKIAVIGNENFAGETALELLTYSKDITILNNGETFNFSEGIKKQLEDNSIRFKETKKLKKFIGEKAEKVEDEEGTVYEFDGFFMALGTASASAFAKELGVQTEGQFIKIDREGKTNIPGIYAAGDCTGSYPQVSTAVGEGTAAAMSIIKKLKNVEVYSQYA